MNATGISPQGEAAPPPASLPRAPDAKAKRAVLLAGAKRLFRRVSGSSRAPRPRDAIREVLETPREEEEHFSPEEKRMLRNVLHVGERTVADAMTPRASIVAVDADISLSELKETLLKERHTRMPVYAGTLDTLRGFIHIKDLIPALAGDEPFDMDALVRDVLFVPPSMKVVDLLAEMRMLGHHVAIVVDEYGGTDGLVTLEDLCEEIVGDIQDEHDARIPDQELRHAGYNLYDADARIRLDRLETLLGVDLRQSEGEEGDYDTLGGLLASRLGRLPKRGEVVDLPPHGRFEVMEADPRRVRKVRIALRQPEAAEQTADAP